jgi:hypothetical protein
VLYVFIANAAIAQTKPSVPGPYESAPYDLRGFVAEIQQLEASLKQSEDSRERVAAFRTQLPVKWQVNTPDHKYEISSEPLRSILLDAERDPIRRRSHLEEADGWLRNLGNQAREYPSRAAALNSGARKQLDEILSRREFSAVRPPNAWDRFKQRISDWLLRVIGKLLRQIGRHPWGAEFLFWFFIAAAVAWISIMLIRAWGGRARMEEMQNIDHVPVHRTWQEWIRAAKLAADAGNFREAVHSTYWAGITCLEDRGAVTVDRTRTPREYLQVVEESPDALPFERARYRESLAALTARLERIWYGLRPAQAEDFEECMRKAEGLGCRLQ